MSASLPPQPPTKRGTTIWERITSTIAVGALALGGIVTSLALPGSGIRADDDTHTRTRRSVGTGVSVNVGGKAAAGWEDRFPYAVFFDNAEDAYIGSAQQGWEGDSINFFISQAERALTARGYRAFSSTYRSHLVSACTQALAQANQRDPSAGRARVVGLMIWYHMTKGEAFANTDGTGSRTSREFDEGWSATANQLYGWAGDSDLTTLHDEMRAHAYEQNIGVICGAANSHEPPPPTYTLSVQTDKMNAPARAGESTPVADTIHATNTQSKSEQLTGSIALIYTSPEG